MSAAPTTPALAPGDAFVRRVTREWRALTGGPATRDADRRTLVACSGGPDSSALLLALAASAGKTIVAAHIVHDLRPADESQRDREAAAALAQALGVRFAVGAAAARAGGGNLEAGARRARYAELTRLARDHGCPFVATGHHAGDQLETMLMRLIRGCGPAAAAGMRPVRPLGDLSLVRPMLALDPAELSEACARAGWSPAHDRTNEDVSRLRARLRHGAVAEILRARPGAGARLAESSVLLAEAGDLVREHAESLLRQAGATDALRPGGVVRMQRATLAAAAPVVRGEVIRVVRRALLGEGGADRERARELRAAARAVAEPGSRMMRAVGLTIEIGTEHVEIRHER